MKIVLVLLSVILAATAASAQQKTKSLSEYRKTAPIETKPDGRSGSHIWDLTDVVFQVGGVRTHAIDLATGRAGPGRLGGKQGPSLWNNMAISGWGAFPGLNYINLDWGLLQPTSSGLPDEVIDGFTFVYGTNNIDPKGESITIRYFDSCTGRGSMGIEEASFAFTGLPNAATFGTLPPGYGWTVQTTVDLEGSGYEFILGERIGIGWVLTDKPPAPYGTGPALGRAPNTYGNGPTGTRHLFDTYYPNGVWENSWWMCSGLEHWCTWPGELFGPGGAATGMTYYGIGASGNDAALYTCGSFAPASDIRFLLRRNGSPLAGWLLASCGERNRYLPVPDVTQLIGGLTPWSPLPMVSPVIGDFLTFDSTVPAAAGGARIYFQAVLSDPPPWTLPIDATNGVRAN